MPATHCAIIQAQQFRMIEVLAWCFMRFVISGAGALLTLICSLPALAQPSDPAAANRELIGKGPNISVQQSAIGTLDVGGPGAANPNVTGENLRGNLGASRPQPAPGTPLPTPNAGVPNYSFETPNLGPDLRGSAPGRKPTKQELRVAEDIILPRFRSHQGEVSQVTASTRGADGWRYRHFNGRWWYWKPNETWAYWDGSEWRDRASRR